MGKRDSRGTKVGGLSVGETMSWGTRVKGTWFVWVVGSSNERGKLHSKRN